MPFTPIARPATRRHVQSAAGQVQFGPKSENQTATADAEDVLTPVVVRAAEAIVTRGAHK